MDLETSPLHIVNFGISRFLLILGHESRKVSHGTYWTEATGDRVVGIATRYRLEDSGFEPLSVREIFSLLYPSRPTQTTVQ